MRRGAWALVVAGVVAGAVIGIVVWRSDSGGEARRPAPSTTSSVPATTTEPTTTAPASLVPADVLLVWTPGGLPGGLAAGLGQDPSISAVAAVRGDELGLAGSVDARGEAVDGPPAGFVIPLDTVAVDPAALAAVLPAAGDTPLAGLTPTEGLLGETSARLRGVDTGGVLTLEGGTTVTVAGVIADELVGAVELVVTYAGGERLGLTTERFLVARHAGDRAAAEEAVRSRVPDGTPVRVRAAEEVGFLRHADAVLPPALLKEALGEFSHRSGGGRDLTLDPAWVDEHLTTATVPLLGSVRCNREMLPALEGAMRELEAEGLGGLIETYEGCFAPRRIRAGAPVSRHAWGGAIDVNFGTGRPGPQDPRLTEVMARWGFVSGDEFLVPDSGHYELVDPP